MNRKFVLHIGVPKTGTTTVQNFLDRNGESLGAEGLGTLRVFGRKNNPGLSIYAQEFRESVNPRRDRRRKLGVDSPDKLHHHRQQTEEALQQEIAGIAETVHTLVVSSELCATLSLEQVERVKSLLAPYASAFEIVVYLREQYEQFRSSYSTALRIGYAGTLLEWAHHNKSKDTFFYDRLLASWEAVFGAEALKVRIFDAAELERGDIVCDFCSLIGAGWRDHYSLTRAANESIAAPVQEVARAWNRALPPRPDPGTLAAIYMVKRRLGSGNYRGRGADLPAAEILALRDAYRRSNDSVCARWFKNRSELFASKLPETGSTFTDQEAEQLVTSFVFSSVTKVLRGVR